LFSPPAYFYMFIMVPLRLCCLAWPHYCPPLPQLHPQDVDTTRQKIYRYSLSYTCMELLLRERTQILIPFSHLEIDWALWPCGLRHGSAAVRWLGLWVQIPPGTWMSSHVSVVCCQRFLQWASLPFQRSPTKRVCTHKRDQMQDYLYTYSVQLEEVRLRKKEKEMLWLNHEF